MKGDAIGQRDDTEVSTKLRYKNPIAHASVLRLDLTSNRIGQCFKTPAQLDIRPLRQHVLPKIIRHRRLGHHLTGSDPSATFASGSLAAVPAVQQNGLSAVSHIGCASRNTRYRHFSGRAPGVSTSTPTPSDRLTSYWIGQRSNRVIDSVASTRKKVAVVVFAVQYRAKEPCIAGTVIFNDVPNLLPVTVKRF